MIYADHRAAFCRRVAYRYAQQGYDEAAREMDRLATEWLNR